MRSSLPYSMPHTNPRTAFAKVNLGLEILRKRPDGYHDLETIFYRIGLADEIEVHPADDLTMECDDPSLPIGRDNLCLKAAESLRQKIGGTAGAHIVLRKRIPTGAGLGGGSSDAATVLVALNELWETRLPTKELREIGASIGSDVPGFLASPLSYATGRGEVLEDLPPHFPYWLVTVTPPVAVSTAWAYGQLKLSSDEPRAPLRDRFLNALPNLDYLGAMLRNDFEQAVLGAYPQIAAAKRSLLKTRCACALLSGSGSSVFGLTDDRSIAETAIMGFSEDTVTSLTPPLI